MPPRPPADAIVALRSLARRYRAIFAGLGDDEAPDDVAHRVGAGGFSAIDHLAGTSRTLTTAARALERILVEDDPVLDPVDVDTRAREAEQQPGGTVDERISELELDAGRLAERASRVSARDWGRTARTADGTPVSASEVLWLAVDSAVDHLRQAEQVIREVRGRPR